MKLRNPSASMAALLLGALAVSCGSSNDNENEASPQRWVLTMADEFDGEDGSAPDDELWEIETGYGFDNSGWGNDEWQLYTDSRDNVRVERKRTEDGSLEDDGYLAISALCSGERCGKRDDTITSARIKTQRLFEQKYGRFEARIKLPRGLSLWPAFWMLGANIEEVPWPGCGEIDIMEHYGNRPTRAEASLHGPGYFGADPISNHVDLPEGEVFADDFHVFAVEWDPSRLTFWIDGQVENGVVVGGEAYHTVSAAAVASRGGDWVFRNTFFLLLNLAVEPNRAGSVDKSVFPADMLVDWVRVYERAP